MGANALRAVRAAVVPLVLLVAVGALALRSAPEARGISFNPQFEASLTDDTPGAASDIVLDFSINEPEPNFEAIVSFFPPEMYIAPDADVPNGALAGKLEATATLGLFNGDCNTLLPVLFELMESSTDIDDRFPLYGGYQDYDGNGLPENVDHYPDFLARLAPNLQPIERLYGQTIVAGVQTFINFVVFEPGAAIARLPLMDASLGYPVVVYLNDPTTPVIPYAISDFCSPLGTVTTVFGTSRDNPEKPGDESGVVLKRNPQNAGLYNEVAFVRSQWDADGDGIENTLDPCPFTLDPDWSPRQASLAADTDTDGLPNSCDPTPTDANIDQDEDGYLNKQDICPLVAINYPTDIDHDGIGDLCDPAPEDPSNGGVAQRVELCITTELAVGGGGGAAPNVACPSGPDIELPPLLIVDAFGDRFPVGTVVTLRTFLNDPLSATPIPAINVSFEVTGANPTTGNCTTDNFGSCEFNFAGPNIGIDTINASADVGTKHITDTLTIEWVNPPINDDFAAATAIGELPFEAETTLAAASQEPLESRDCGIERSVWFQFTPQSDVFVKVEASAGPDDYPYLGLFEGPTVGTISPVSCGYLYYSLPLSTSAHPAKVDGREAYLFASLEGGQTYHIQVGGFVFGGGLDDLTIEMSEAIRGDTNCDDLVDALDILGILKMTAGFGPTSCYGAADFDCSGYVSTEDVMSEMKLQAEVWSPKPCKLQPQPH